MWKYYAILPFWSRWFVRLRRRIAPFEWVLPHIQPEDHILDIGGGHGLLANLIKFHYPQTDILATDADKKRISKARRTIQGRSGLRFEVAKAFPESRDSFDVILFFDVLHHLPREDHKTILSQAKTRLKPHGRIIIKEMWKEFSIPHFLNWLHDKVITFGKFTYYRTRKDWLALTQTLDFQEIHFQRGYKFWYHQFLTVLENSGGSKCQPPVSV